MKLPQRVQWRGVGWFRFLTCCTLDIVLMLAIFLSPILLWLTLTPHTFWEKLVCVIVTGICMLITGVCAFMFGAYFITWTTGW